MINYWYASKQVVSPHPVTGSIGSPDLRPDLEHIQRAPSTQQQDSNHTVEEYFVVVQLSPNSMDGLNTLHLFEPLEARRSETIPVNRASRRRSVLAKRKAAVRGTAAFV
jgi:hypothetical protein